MKRLSHIILASFAALTLAASGCSSCGSSSSGPKATREDISMMPREANFIVMTNLTKLRGTPMWKRVTELRDDPASKPRYEDFVKKSGLDPLNQIDSVFVAFPTNAQQNGEFGGVIRGGPFDEAKLVAWAKEESTKAGAEIAQADVGGKKAWRDHDGNTFVLFLDAKTIVFGGKEWIKKIVDLTGKDGDSAAKNEALTALVKKTKTGDAFWLAGIVPDEVRARLKEDPRLSSAATMKDVYGSIDVKTGFAMTSTVDLAGAAEAKELAARVSDQLADAKKNPQVQMLGMSTFLDAVKVAADQGGAFHLDISLTQTQVDDLVNRVQGLMKTLGGALGGGGGGLGGGGLGGGGMEPPVPVPAPPTAPNP